MRRSLMTISVIMPCLNEGGSVGGCVESALHALSKLRTQNLELRTKSQILKSFEVLVVDNGSSDYSVEIARKAGAKVIQETKKGYGNALLRGIKEAKGEIIVMGDSDGSYDWGEIGRLVGPFLKEGIPLRSLVKLVPPPTGGVGLRGTWRLQKKVDGVKFSYKQKFWFLRPLYVLLGLTQTGDQLTTGTPSFIPDFIVGTRLRGEIEKGAMPFLNRYLGTPILNFFLRLFYGINLSDSQSGFRAFRKSAITKLNLRSGGMEFASEMLVKAKQAGLAISEVPITYRRREGKSKLSPVRDAWRHIRFMLFFSPTWLFLVPGGAIGLIGLLSFIRLSFGPFFLFGRYFDIHSMIVASFIATLGFQISFLGLFAKTYAFLYLEQKDRLIEKLLRWFTLEKGLLVGGILGFWGILGFLGVLGTWVGGGFRALDAARPILLSITILSLAIQAIFGSFFFALLGSRWER